jgi:hypothetical protein
MPEKKKKILIELHYEIKQAWSEMARLENGGSGYLKKEIEKFLIIKALKYNENTEKARNKGSKDQRGTSTL